jgi:Cu2+-containing amine oxidase
MLLNAQDHLTKELPQNRFHEAVVNLSLQKVERNVRLGANIHAPGDVTEIIAMEKIGLEDEQVKKAIKKLRLPAGSVVISDPWIYGMSQLTFQSITYEYNVKARMALMMMNGCTNAFYTCEIRIIQPT